MGPARPRGTAVAFLPLEAPDEHREYGRTPAGTADRPAARIDPPDPEPFRRLPAHVDRRPPRYRALGSSNAGRASEAGRTQAAALSDARPAAPARSKLELKPATSRPGTLPAFSLIDNGVTHDSGRSKKARGNRQRHGRRPCRGGGPSARGRPLRDL